VIVQSLPPLPVVTDMPVGPLMLLLVRPPPACTDTDGPPPLVWPDTLPPPAVTLDESEPEDDADVPLPPLLSTTLQLLGFE
jgi:hypothetical protein